jgi:hypothetical protein
VQRGSGWLDPTNSNAPVVTSQGIFSYLDFNGLKAALGSNQPVFYQEAPGNFAQAQPNLSGLAAGTPLYIQVPNNYTTPAAPVFHPGVTSGPVAPV